MKLESVSAREAENHSVLDVLCRATAVRTLNGGALSQGSTRNEALANIREAIQVYLESLTAHDEAIPPSIDEEVVEVAV